MMYMKRSKNMYKLKQLTVKPLSVDLNVPIMYYAYIMACVGLYRLYVCFICDIKGMNCTKYHLGVTWKVNELKEQGFTAKVKELTVK